MLCSIRPVSQDIPNFGVSGFSNETFLLNLTVFCDCIFTMKAGRFIWSYFLVIAIIVYSHIPSFGERGAAVQDSVYLLVKSLSERYSVDGAQNVISYLERNGAIEDKVVFSSKSSEDEVMMNVYYYASDYFYGKQEYPLCTDFAAKALECSNRTGDKDFQADILNLLAIGNIRMANYDKAASYAEQCYVLDLQSGDHDRISSSLNTLAGIYVTSKRYQDAEKYVLRGIEECRKADNKPRQAILMGMASEVYHAMGKSDVALEYAQKAYDLEKELGREPQAMVRLSQKAAALIGLARYEEAEKDLQEAISFFRQSGNLQSLGISCNKMGGVLHHLGRNQEASQYYGQAADIFVRLGDPYNEMHSRKGLYESLLDIDSREAKLQHDRYDQIKDSLYTLAAAESLSRYNAEMDNDTLKAENLRARRTKSLLISGIIALIVLSGIVWYLLLQRSRRQKAAMEAALRKLRSEYIHLRDDYQDIVQSKAETAAKEAEPSEEERSISSSDRTFLDKLASYVISNLDSGHLGVEDIASHMCLSSGQLNRRIKTITGFTTQNYVLRLRLEQARILLQGEPQSQIADIAYRCGFEDAASFSRAFKRVFDATPSQIRG